MHPIAPGWTRIPEPEDGGDAFMNKDSGLYALRKRMDKVTILRITDRGTRPRLADCAHVLNAFGLREAQEVSTGRDIFRRFEKAAPLIYGQQVDLF